MVMQILGRLFGTKNSREINRMKKVSDQILKLEDQYTGLSDDALQDLRHRFSERLAAGETLKSLMPEAFAAVREAGKRALNMRIFDVQMIGAIALHEGRISEMRTGEGKTLMATLPVYLNALSGEGAFVVTVNDYLSERDSKWNGKLFSFLV